MSREFPLCLSRLRTQLVSMRMWVRSLASLSGVRIWCCHKLQGRSRMRLRSPAAIAVAVVQAGGCSSDWTPSPGTPICPKCSSKKKKRKKRKFSRHSPSPVLPKKIFYGGSSFYYYYYYSWFTMLCQFLLYSKVTQPYIYIYVYIPFLMLSSIMVHPKRLDIV